MKRNGASARPVRRDRLIQEHNHDTYKARGKCREPAVCPDCGAVYHKGRWQWITRPSPAADTPLPGLPADTRPLSRLPRVERPIPGATSRRIVHLARNVEEREKSEHPPRRIMAMESRDNGILITTTAMELARAIGDAVHHAYQGALDYRYTDEANILRVSGDASAARTLEPLRSQS